MLTKRRDRRAILIRSTYYKVSCVMNASCSAESPKRKPFWAQSVRGDSGKIVHGRIGLYHPTQSFRDILECEEGGKLPLRQLHRAAAMAGAPVAAAVDQHVCIAGHRSIRSSRALSSLLRC